MTRRGRYSRLWVRMAIASGILLGIVLLTQTIATYFFVYGKIIREEAAQEAERKQATLLRAAANAGIHSIQQISPVVAELYRDNQRQVAWIRIFDIDGNITAQSGAPKSKPPTAARIRQLLMLHQAHQQEFRSPNGSVLAVTSRMRLFGPPHAPPPPQAGVIDRAGPPREAPSFIEIGIYVDQVTVHLGGLRQNLIVGCLAAIALVASTILIAVFFNRDIRARALEQQIELARSVQTDLLPSAAGRPSENLDFAAAFFPASTVGGDFYDVFTSASGPISIVLGDVAGKGISAALLMGVLHGAIRSMNWTQSASDQESASQWLNKFLCEKTARERFVSLFWACFIPETGTLRYINAGHLPPLLVRATSNGPARVEHLESGGPVLGVLPHAAYCSASVQVEPGDILVVFSDGVCEASNAKDQEFGDSRIGQIVQANSQKPPQAICDAILNDVKAFLGPLKPHDDQTLLVVRLAPMLTAVKPVENWSSSAILDRA